MQLHTQQATAEAAPFAHTAEAWNLDYLVDYMVKNGQERDYIRECVDEYKRFIDLCVTHPDQSFPISAAVDEVWHTHILFTKDYIGMCGALGVGYLHHDPRTSDAEFGMHKDAYDQLLKLYTQVFGEKPREKFWPAKLDARCCSLCGQPGVTATALAN